MNKSKTIKVTLFAGGVGGAKLAEGLDNIDNLKLSIIGNVADDEMFHGLWVSPDIDTITYTLSGLVNRTQGWGLQNETQNALSMLKNLDCDTWMMLGDKDFGLHIYRTERRNKGDRPSVIARDIAKLLKVKSEILLPTDDVIQTKVKTEKGWLSFQEYFVKEKCIPEVQEICYEGISQARANQECIETIQNSDFIVIAPSNPILSISPILEINGIRSALIDSNAPILSVSPLISGKAIKGPAAKILSSLGMRSDSLGIAKFYSDFCKLIVVDSKDRHLDEAINALGVSTSFTDIFMNDIDGKIRIAKHLVKLYQETLGT